MMTHSEKYRDSATEIACRGASTKGYGGPQVPSRPIRRACGTPSHGNRVDSPGILGINRICVSGFAFLVRNCCFGWLGGAASGPGRGRTAAHCCSIRWRAELEDEREISRRNQASHPARREHRGGSPEDSLTQVLAMGSLTGEGRRTSLEAIILFPPRSTAMYRSNYSTFKAGIKARMGKEPC